MVCGWVLSTEIDAGSYFKLFDGTNDGFTETPSLCGSPCRVNQRRFPIQAARSSTRGNQSMILCRPSRQSRHCVAYLAQSTI